MKNSSDWILVYRSLGKNDSPGRGLPEIFLEINNVKNKYNILLTTRNISRPVAYPKRNKVKTQKSKN